MVGRLQSSEQTAAYVAHNSSREAQLPHLPAEKSMRSSRSPDGTNTSRPSAATSITLPNGTPTREAVLHLRFLIENELH